MTDAKPTCSEGDGRKVLARGLCRRCYERKRKDGTLGLKPPPDPTRKCAAEGCGGTAYARDLCNACYKKGRKDGTLERQEHRPEVTPRDLFWRVFATVLIDDGCWYRPNNRRTGYGHITIDGKSVLVHRLSYEWFVGPIPDGLEIDHRCHDPEVCKLGDACPHRHCVNPSHLRPATDQENTLNGNSPAGINARKTHCPNNHEYDGINSRGARTCSICRRAQSV